MSIDTHAVALLGVHLIFQSDTYRIWTQNPSTAPPPLSKGAPFQESKPLVHYSFYWFHEHTHSLF